MSWMAVVEKLWYPFMIAFAIFVVFANVFWIKRFHRTPLALRDFLGVFGLVGATASSLVYFYYYVGQEFQHHAMAHGSVLWLIYYGGACLGFAGVMLGMFGRNEQRLFTVVISTVTIFLWSGEMIYGRRAEAVLASIMYLCIAAELGIAATRKLVRRAHV